MSVGGGKLSDVTISSTRVLEEPYRVLHNSFEFLEEIVSRMSGSRADAKAVPHPVCNLLSDPFSVRHSVELATRFW